MPLPPSGEQFELSESGQKAVVTEVGATLRHYSVHGLDIVDGFPPTEMCSGGRGQVLAPWPNRLRAGRYSWEGSERQLPVNEPDRNNAIHGLVRWQAWTVDDRAVDRVALSHTIHPQEGYPFCVRLCVTYSLNADGLAVEVSASNEGEDDAPFGIGFHPYLSVGHGPVDDLVLTCPARTVLVADEFGIPTGREAVAGDLDFGTARPVRDQIIDTAFTDLDRGPTGLSEVVVARGEDRVTLWADQAFGYVMVFTGDTLTADRRRRALAVEPMTCPPNALASGESLVTLVPGASWPGRWGLRPGS